MIVNWDVCVKFRRELRTYVQEFGNLGNVSNRNSMFFFSFF